MCKRRGKTVLAAMLSLLLSLTLAGCADSANPQEAGTAGIGAETADTQARHEVLLQGDAVLLNGEKTALTDGALVIREAGEYELSGSFPEGKILIAVEGEDSEVLLVFNGVSVCCPDGPALEVLHADSLTVRLADGSVNTLHSGGVEVPEPEKDAAGAALLTEGSLTLEGDGSLKVEGFVNNGIACKKDLCLQAGRLEVTAANSGIRANRALELRSGTVSIEAGNDGLCTRSDKQQGDITIAGGILTVQAGGDGIASAGELLIKGGKLEITTDGDPEISSSKGIRADKEICIAGGEISVSSTDHALRCSEAVSISGGNLLLHSLQGKGLAAEGAVRIEGDPVIMAEAAGSGIETKTDLLISGGSIRVTAGGDGLRAGDSGTGEGTLSVNAGDIRVCASGDGLDAKIQMSITGGRLFALGNSYRVRPFSEESTQPFLCIKLEETAAGRFSIRDSQGREVNVMDTPVPVDTLHVSAPELVQGESYELLAGEAAVTLEAK